MEQNSRRGNVIRREGSSKNYGSVKWQKSTRIMIRRQKMKNNGLESGGSAQKEEKNRRRINIGITWS